MIRMMLIVVAALAGPGAFAGAGAEPSEPSSSGDRSVLQTLVPQLGADAFARRQAAEEKLIEFGPEIVPALKRHAETYADNAEVSMRLERIIRAIRLRARPVGETVNGLKYVLEADGPLLAFDQPVTLTTTIINTTREDLTVRVGYSTGGNYFTSGSAVRLVRPTDGEAPEGERVLGVLKPSSRVGFCGTGAYPINTIIEAGDSVAYETKLRLVRLERAAGENRDQLHISTHDRNWYVFPTDGEETVRFVTTLNVSERHAGSRGMNPKRVVSNGNHWHGKIRSNPVEVTIDRDGEPDQRASGQ